MKNQSLLVLLGIIFFATTSCIQTQDLSPEDQAIAVFMGKSACFGKTAKEEMEAMKTDNPEDLQKKITEAQMKAKEIEEEAKQLNIQEAGKRFIEDEKLQKSFMKAVAQTAQQECGMEEDDKLLKDLEETLRTGKLE